MKRVLCLFLALCTALCLFACAKETPASPESKPSAPTADETAKTPADYSTVYAALAEIPSDRSLYTKKTLAVLDQAVADIRYGQDVENQEIVNACAEKIRAAIALLEKKPVFTSYREILDYVDSLGIDFDDLASFDMSPYFEDTILNETEDAGQEYLDGTYYIGDSLTLYMHRYCTLPKKNIYGVGSINPKHAAEDDLVTLANGTKATFAEAMGEEKPARVVLTIGTNSMLMNSIDYVSYFGKLIDDIRAASPDTVIIIQSTSPLTADYEKNMTLLTNRNINRSNLLLAGLASYKGAYYLNTAEALKDENGQLDVKFDLGEGYGHINADAYAIWESYMRTHAVPQ